MLNHICWCHHSWFFLLAHRTAFFHCLYKTFLRVHQKTIGGQTLKYRAEIKRTVSYTINLLFCKAENIIRSHFRTQKTDFKNPFISPTIKKVKKISQQMNRKVSGIFVQWETFIYRLYSGDSLNQNLTFPRTKIIVPCHIGPCEFHEIRKKKFCKRMVRSRNFFAPNSLIFAHK